ncbi:MAG: hypothetical protein AAGB19_19170, partial [Cyanobacteria bacterium P01_F01_bin.3]
PSGATEECTWGGLGRFVEVGRGEGEGGEGVWAWRVDLVQATALTPDAPRVRPVRRMKRRRLSGMVVWTGDSSTGSVCHFDEKLVWVSGTDFGLAFLQMVN